MLEGAKPQYVPLVGTVERANMQAQIYWNIMEILTLAEEEGHSYLLPYCYRPECSESLSVK